MYPPMSCRADQPHTLDACPNLPPIGRMGLSNILGKLSSEFAASSEWFRTQIMENYQTVRQLAQVTLSRGLM